MNTAIGIVIGGGGNIFRGVSASASGMDRATADYMGMLATVMNSLALQDALAKGRAWCRACNRPSTSSRSWNRTCGRRPCNTWRESKVVVFAAGTGNPFSPRIPAAALRGAEIGAEIVLKATKVDGVYTADPKTDKTATRYHERDFRRGHRQESEGDGRHRLGAVP